MISSPQTIGFNDFGVFQPLVSMVFNGHDPLVQRCDGFNVSTTSTFIWNQWSPQTSRAHGSRKPAFSREKNQQFCFSQFIGNCKMMRTYKQLIWGKVVLNSGLRFSFWAPEVPDLRVRKRQLKKGAWIESKPPFQSGLHKLFHPAIPGGIIWRKLGEHGEHKEYGIDGKHHPDY